MVTLQGYKVLGIDLVEPLQDQPRKSRRPPMGDEKKDEGTERLLQLQLFSQIFEKFWTLLLILSFLDLFGFLNSVVFSLCYSFEFLSLIWRKLFSFVLEVGWSKSAFV